jgi:hypothetical protein
MNARLNNDGIFVKLTCVLLFMFNMYFFYKNGGLTSEHLLAGLLLNIILITSTFIYVKLREEINDAVIIIMERVVQLLAEMVPRRAET